jgi:hypothetical protein
MDGQWVDGQWVHGHWVDVGVDKPRFSQDPSVTPVLFADIFILACLPQQDNGRSKAGKPNFPIGAVSIDTAASA